MAKQDLILFRDLLNSDTEFQEEFRKAAESYTGEQDEKAVFDNLLLPLAEKHGLSATYDEFRTYIESLSSTDGELSEDELEQIAGGKDSGNALCVLVGAGDMFGSNGGASVISSYACEVVGLAGVRIPFVD